LIELFVQLVSGPVRVKHDLLETRAQAEIEPVEWSKTMLSVQGVEIRDTGPRLLAPGVDSNAV